MRKIAKIMGLVILIISIFSVAMAEDEYVGYLGSLSPSLVWSVEGQRLIFQHIFTHDTPPYKTEYYRDGFTDYYHINHSIFKIKYGRYVLTDGDFKSDYFGAVNAGIVKKENDKLPGNIVSNVFNILGLLSRAFPGAISYSLEDNEKWYDISDIYHLKIPKNKDIVISINMYNGPDYLDIGIWRSNVTHAWMISDIDIYIYQPKK